MAARVGQSWDIPTLPCRSGQSIVNDGKFGVDLWIHTRAEGDKRAIPHVWTTYLWAVGSLGKSWGETARRYAAPHGWDEPPGTAPVSPLRTAPVPPLAQETWPTRLTRIYPYSSRKEKAIGKLYYSEK